MLERVIDRLLLRLALVLFEVGLELLPEVAVSVCVESIWSRQTAIFTSRYWRPELISGRR